MKKHMTLTFLGIVLPHCVLVYRQDLPDSKPCGKSILLLDRALISAFGFLHYACIKGQIISKRLLVSSDSSKKQTNKFVFFFA